MKFQDVTIGADFRWRDSAWTKTDKTHAVNADCPGNEDPEHIPSHDEVEAIAATARVQGGKSKPSKTESITP